jgi:hypothetical protein
LPGVLLSARHEGDAAAFKGGHALGEGKMQNDVKENLLR